MTAAAEEAKAKKLVADAEAKAKEIIDAAKEESKDSEGEKEDGEDRSYNDYFNDLYAAVSRQIPDGIDKDLTLRQIAGLQADTRSIHTRS